MNLQVFKFIALLAFCLFFAALGANAVAAQEFVLPKAPVQIAVDCEDCPRMVTLPSGLRISEAAVTRSEFAKFVEDTGYANDGWGCRWDSPGIEQSDRDPVVCITFEAAVEYTLWLTKRTGVKYELPSVDEYRYAALGGEVTAYWWGDTIGQGRANCIGCGSPFDGKRTAPVDSFEANPFGLRDAVGNVWQWTRDCVADDCLDHYLIGGSWLNQPADLRVSKLIWNVADKPSNTYGLRVVAAELPL